MFITPAEAIKKIRWELRLSQQKLATALGTTQAAISAYERDLSEPGYVMLKKIDEFAKRNKVEVKFF